MNTFRVKKNLLFWRAKLRSSMFNQIKGNKTKYIKRMFLSSNLYQVMFLVMPEIFILTIFLPIVEPSVNSGSMRKYTVELINKL